LSATFLKIPLWEKALLSKKDILINANKIIIWQLKALKKMNLYNQIYKILF